ncbi:hypothetical protein BDY21DRAFT_368504 [Lineolata rhizophorae]|uniref:Hydrophobic surface binding protein A-domain-containing protein n=1 Tax=Lineolata rhizophorae TaxID=578093 RepID=A0A6A6PEM0_9PEZI|nr:hypothetical protein BDY21DRAFT_368504 [Lineolata rhizophorae]
MASRSFVALVFFACALLFLGYIPHRAAAQSSAPATTSFPTTNGTTNGTSPTSTRSGSVGSASGPPDVWLNVPDLSVGRIELDVDDLRADINLNAAVAGLVNVNAGVAVSIQKVNITISEVQAKLDLVVRLGHLVDIVNRVFDSLDLNPLLISAVSTVTGLVDTVVGEVAGLLGSITQGGNTVSFLIDNLGNIISQVLGGDGNPVSQIVGDYKQNMTFTGDSQTLPNGLIQKTYTYSPLNALVDIITNAAGQVVQATVQRSSTSGSSGGGSPSTSAAATTTTGAGASTSAPSSASATPTTTG